MHHALCVQLLFFFTLKIFDVRIVKCDTDEYRMAHVAHSVRNTFVKILYSKILKAAALTELSKVCIELSHTHTAAAAARLLSCLRLAVAITYVCRVCVYCILVLLLCCCCCFFVFSFNSRSIRPNRIWRRIL